MRTGKSSHWFHDALHDPFALSTFRALYHVTSLSLHESICIYVCFCTYAYHLCSTSYLYFSIHGIILILGPVTCIHTRVNIITEDSISSVFEYFTLQAVFTPNNYAVSKCPLPRESTVIWLYIFGGAAIFFWITLTYRRLCRRSRWFKIS
jgi:hypothetical protein